MAALGKYTLVMANKNVLFCAGSDSNYTVMMELLEKCGLSNPYFYYPAVFIYDNAGDIRYFSTGLQLDKLLKAIDNTGNTTVTATPTPVPATPTLTPLMGWKMANVPYAEVTFTQPKGCFLHTRRK